MPTERSADVEISVRFDDLDYLPGARLLALMAFPPMSPNDTRWQIAERALGRLVWLAREAMRPSALRRPQKIIPDHLTLPEAAALREHEKIKKNLGYRMGAAHVVMPYLQALEKGMRRRLNSLRVDREIQRTIMQEEEYRDWMKQRKIPVPNRFPTDVNNFDNRVLRRSLPVIHLAAATAIQMEVAQSDLQKRPETETVGMPHDQAGPQISYADILSSREHSVPIIERANELTELVMKLEQLRPPFLVRLKIE